MADDISSSPPQRLSRYRSQRKAQQQALVEEVPDVPAVPQEPEQHVDDGIARSRSRYHRKNGGSGQARPATARDPEHVDVVHRTKTQSPPSQAARPVTNHRKASDTRDQYAHRQASPPTQLGAQDPDSDYVNRDGYGAENDRRRHYSAYDASRNVEPPPSKPTGELFPPPRPEPVRPSTKPVQLDGPPTSDKIRATKSMSQLPKFEDDDGESGGCFGFFKRKRCEVSPGAPEKTPIARPLHKSAGMQDTPMSAVNAGDRRVLIECGKSKTIFPVTPTTTAVDLIKSASNCMSERIDVRSAVLLEYFGSVGVQRPLRRYEHIRVVMNSWDSDKQNSLILIEPGTGRSELELSIAGAPKQRPEECSWWLSYSQKVGKWDKRLVILKEDGHIIAQKDPDKPQQWDNVCHLNDFDIYTPTPEKLKKKVKPPKKHCYAIKSQQKTIMFESTQNFVHFFSTGDKATADDFYAAVQGWRSWYLVHVLDEGKKPKSPDAAVNKEVGGAGTKGHRSGESFDSHYQLGSFKPLIDMEQFDNKRPTTSRSANAPPPSSGGFVKSANQFDPMVSPERRTSTRKKEHPPLSFKNQAKHPHLADDEPLGNFAARTSQDGGRPTNGDFTDSGLLGRSYSQRQRDLSERENQKAQPFTSGPNLLNGGYGEDEFDRRQSLDGGVRRNQSTRAGTTHKANGNGDVKRTKSSRHHGSGDLGRSTSTRKPEMPKPLVDLTPQYREPPQHVKKGRGHHPDQLGPGGLIDSATSPEDPLGIPASTDWRGRNAQNRSPGIQHSASRHGRTKSVSRRERPTTSRSPEGNDDAFTGEGLLAGGQAQRGWGGGDKGRGVVDMSAARSGQPLLDVREDSRFTKGSLLNKVEKTQPQGPIIDREKEY